MWHTWENHRKKSEYSEKHETWEPADHLRGNGPGLQVTEGRVSGLGKRDWALQLRTPEGPVSAAGVPLGICLQARTGVQKKPCPALAVFQGLIRSKYSGHQSEYSERPALISHSKGDHHTRVPSLASPTLCLWTWPRSHGPGSWRGGGRNARRDWVRVSSGGPGPCSLSSVSPGVSWSPDALLSVAGCTALSHRLPAAPSPSTCPQCSPKGWLGFISTVPTIKPRGICVEVTCGMKPQEQRTWSRVQWQGQTLRWKRAMRMGGGQIAPIWISFCTEARGTIDKLTQNIFRNCYYTNM